MDVSIIYWVLVLFFLLLLPLFWLIVIKFIAKIFAIEFVKHLKKHQFIK